MKRILSSSTILVFALSAFAQQPAAPAKTPAKSTGATQSKAPAKSTTKAPTKAAAKAPVAAPALVTPKDKFSYALGMNISQGMKAQGLDIDIDLLLRGLRDAHTGAQTQLTPQEMGEILTRARQEIDNKRIADQRAVGEKNKVEGEAFLARNKARPGVVTLPSGLQYEVISPGNGPSPKATDTVTTHYRGTLIDGTEFDSSYKRNEPATFSLAGGLIQGWIEALQLMKVGAKWKLYVPANLAYGEQQRGQLITPNSVLVFEIELLAIKPQP